MSEQKLNNKKIKIYFWILIISYISFWILFFSVSYIFGFSYQDVFQSEYTKYVIIGLVIWHGIYVIEFLNVFGKIQINWPEKLNQIFFYLKVFFFLILILAGVSGGLVWGLTSIEMWPYTHHNFKEPYLTWTSNTTTTMTITWETDTEIPTTLMLGSSAESLNSVSGLNSTPSQHHMVILTGLIPYTRYYYKVGGFDKTYSFRTAATPASTNRVRFILYGDNRYNNARISGPLKDDCAHPAIVNQILKMYSTNDGDLDYNFTANVGDIVLHGGETFHWQKFHEEIVPLASKRPYMISFGNHEYYSGDTQFTENELRHAHMYWEYNDSSGDEKDYWFSVGNVMFLVFGSGEWGQVTPKQAAWINQTLATYGPKYQWIFTINHHPMISHGDENANLTSMLEDIFTSNGVDVSLTGHVHDYQRLEDTSKNWTQIVCGGGGASLHKPTYNDPTTNATMSMYHFMEWDIVGNHAHAKVILENGTIWEEFDLYSS
ncbi:MAG: purple acid phosphatase family protein [Promethearchaeota archaeon]